MKKFLTVLVILAVVVTFHVEQSYAGGELFLSKVIDQSKGYNLSGKYDFKALNDSDFYVKGDVGFENLDSITSQAIEISGAYVINTVATLRGSYKIDNYDTSTSDKNKIGTVALYTKVNDVWTVRTQFEDTNGDGEVTLGIGMVF